MPERDVAVIDESVPLVRVRPRAAAVVLLAVVAATGCRSEERPAARPPASSAPATPAASAPSPAPSSPLPVSGTLTDAPSASAPAVGVPDQAAIRRVLTRTVEAADPSTHFVSDRPPVTTPDGHGGTLTAVIGQRYPTADGKGQLVFFWHGTRFLGWDAVTETDAVREVTAGPGRFRVTYLHYAARDPECCPSLPPAAVTYTWQDDGRLATAGTRPQHGAAVRVRLVP
ncbi:LppP/LprE family lipoprotein [Actinoallomurus rhizosphaericola]|uniref:LppP/LprE family lipoprotein n=1 Tax=Actinoallomurus rhizosphaericola TaxID=2952536 RepID=UPI002091A663|nr:LppP/LprE family lipoprotein [Actinoallomurus rhizosphaericola]MCO5994782.1 LppP/LprE family lipoprotein [Actinoallomurus rhizosphaericola]